MAGPNNVGRDSIYDAPMTTAKVSIPEDYKDLMREVGDGNLSKGARIIVESFIESNRNDDSNHE